MAIDTFANLKTSIADHLDRDDLTSYIPDFITITESRNKQDLHLPDGTTLPPVLIRDMITRTTLTVNARYVSLPSGYLEASTLRLLTNPVTPLAQVGMDEMARLRLETTGKPLRYTIHEQIEFDRTPDQSYDGEIIYYQSVTALSDSNTTNAILDLAPELYLYGSLAAAAPFLMNDDRIPVWAGLYAQARRGVAGADRRSRSVGPQIARVTGATP